MQDGNGLNGSDPLSGIVTAQKLIDAIAAIGGPNYVYVEVAPSSAGSTGGEPGGNIRNGYFYNADRVDYVAGSAQLIEDPAFAGSRRPLVADFIFNGETVRLINVHFTSRLGSDPLMGANQPPTDAGDGARTAAGDGGRAPMSTTRWRPNPTLKLGVLGDFNGFYFEDAIGTLEATGAARPPPAQRRGGALHLSVRRQPPGDRPYARLGRPAVGRDVRRGPHQRRAAGRRRAVDRPRSDRRPLLHRASQRGAVRPRPRRRYGRRERPRRNAGRNGQRRRSRSGGRPELHARRRCRRPLRARFGDRRPDHHGAARSRGGGGLRHRHPRHRSRRPLGRPDGHDRGRRPQRGADGRGRLGRGRRGRDQPEPVEPAARQRQRSRLRRDAFDRLGRRDRHARQPGVRFLDPEPALRRRPRRVRRARSGPDRRRHLHLHGDRFGTA